MRSLSRAVLCLMLAGLGSFALTQRAAADPPTLTASAVFNKATYVTGDEVSIQFSVHNAGTTTATGITALTGPTPNSLQIDGGLGPFSAFGQGATIAAGATVTTTVTGHMTDLSATSVVFDGYLTDPSGIDLYNFSFTAPMTVQTATVSGEVFGDANSSGTPDPGEGLSGLTLSFYYQDGNGQTFSVTTGSGGHFSLVVPTVQYWVGGSGGGWSVIPALVTVPASGLSLNLRAVHPLTKNELSASMHFTQRTYKVGDTAHVVVTLTNNGSTLLRGIGAECNHIGDANELNNRGPGWGPLAYSASGVTLSPHQSQTITVTDTVPAAAIQYGTVVVACDFGYQDVNDGFRPSAIDKATVPGEFGSVSGNVQSFPNGESNPGVGLAGVRVVIVDSTVCPSVTQTTTTNAAGVFTFHHVPPGFDKLYIYPPAGWRVSNGDPTPVLVLGNETATVYVAVKHGTANTPAIPACASTGPSTGTSGPTLANTGVDAASLALVGGAATLLGLILLGFARRRPEFGAQ